MEDTEKEIVPIFKKEEDFKSRVKKWLKDKNNFILILILIFGIALRLYYFSLTKSQPLWWDEADYMAYAKNLAGLPGGWMITPQHNSIFPYAASFFFKLGASEAITKFFIEVIPSILFIFLAYVVGKEMYDKRTGLVVAFLAATSWVILFNTSRFHVGLPAAVFSLVSIYAFWKGFVKQEKIFGKIDPKYALIFVALFLFLTFATRRGFFTLGFFYLFFILLAVPFGRIKEMAKRKYNLAALAILAILIIIAEKFVFQTSVASGAVAARYYHPETPLNFDFFGTYMRYFITMEGYRILFYLFVIGAAVTLISVFLYFDFIRRTEKGHKFKSHLFIILAILIQGSFSFIVTRSPGEPRQFLIIALPMFLIIANGLFFVADNAKKYLKEHGKTISVVLIFGLMAYGGYYEIQHSDGIIKAKIPSYEGIKQASLFVKENSLPTDIILSMSLPQLIYYAEREAKSPHKWVNSESKDYANLPMEPVFEKLRDTPDVRFLFVSFSEPNHPSWMKTVQYGPNGQPLKWEIPFMNTSISFVDGTQDIKPSRTFEDYGITFNLLEIKQDIFIYEIVRS